MPEPIYTLSLQDVKAYAQSKKPGETVGYTRLMEHCLVVRAMEWKFPELAIHVIPFCGRVSIPYGNKTATITKQDGAETTILLPDDVAEVATKFDNIGSLGSAVTRQQLEESIPELFV